MSKRSPARQLAQHLLDEVTSLLEQLAEAQTEIAHLRRQLHDALDALGMPLGAGDEEG